MKTNEEDGTHPFSWGLGDSAGFRPGFCGNDGRAAPVQQLNMKHFSLQENKFMLFLLHAYT